MGERSFFGQFGFGMGDTKVWLGQDEFETTRDISAPIEQPACMKAGPDHSTECFARPVNSKKF